VEQQDANGLSSYLRHKFPFHRFFSHQTHRPARAALWRTAAHHRDNPLFMVGVQHFSGTRSLFLIENAIQTCLLVPMAKPTDGLWSERDHLGDLRGTGTSSQLRECQGPQDYTDLLHPTLQQLSEFSLILFGDIDLQRWTTHTQSMGQNNST